MSKKFPRAAGEKWWDVKAADRKPAEPTATDIWIYDVIGDDWYDPSLTAKELCQKIAAIDTDEIVLHFNSPGGSVSDGIAIYNALITHPAKVTSLVEGWTGSIATVIALAAETVEMFDNVMFMIHNPWGIKVGNAAEMREYADYLDRVGELMAKVYMGRCSKSAEELQDALDAETYLTAEEAVEWGFVDSIREGVAAAACDMSKLEALGFHPEAMPSRDTLRAKVEPPQDSPAAAGDTTATMDTEGLASLLTATRRH